MSLIGSAHALSTIDTAPKAKLDAALVQISAVDNLPALNALPNTSLIPSSKSLPTFVIKTFNVLQLTIFGKTDLISLKTCDGCAATADANTMSVYLDPKFLETLHADFQDDAKQIQQLIVAHELSHFIYEYLTLSSPHGLSPNGNIPLMTKSFMDFIEPNQLAKLNVTEQLAEVTKYMNRASPAHAEVDALAILVLKKIGFNVLPQAKRFLSAEILKHTGATMKDFDVRRTMLDVYFPTEEIKK